MIILESHEMLQEYVYNKYRLTDSLGYMPTQSKTTYIVVKFWQGMNSYSKLNIKLS